MRLYVDLNGNNSAADVVCDLACQDSNLGPML
jgi:hypothetical protein